MSVFISDLEKERQARERQEKLAREKQEHLERRLEEQRNETNRIKEEANRRGNRRGKLIDYK